MPACKTISHPGRGERQPPWPAFSPQLREDGVMGGLSSTSPAASPSCRLRDGGFRETVIKSSSGEDVSLRRKHRQATQSGYESVPELVLNLPSSSCHPLESPPSVFFPQSQGYLQCHSGWQLNLQVCDLRANGFIPGGGYLISRTEVGWLELLFVWSP